MWMSFIQLSGEGSREGLQPSLSPILQIYAALKSSFVAVFADREATADELTPLAISQTAKTISCGNIGRLRSICTVPKPGMTWSMTSTPQMVAKVMPTNPQTESQRGTSRY